MSLYDVEWVPWQGMKGERPEHIVGDAREKFIHKYGRVPDICLTTREIAEAIGASFDGMAITTVTEKRWDLLPYSAYVGIAPEVELA
jgi:hypothetical protein